MKTATNTYKLGIDAGSTTIKLVLLDAEEEIIHKSYRRHKADVRMTLIGELARIKELVGDAEIELCITGSAGMGIAEHIGAGFVQEVIASVNLVRKLFPDTRTLFDIGGEDAKMVFLDGDKHPDIRMNGSCAGGTGAFIDQMASLMNIPVEELGDCAMKYEKIYPIASRCGVFAKTDIQNLISRNVPAPDIAASTLNAVALQCITALARGHDITGPVLCIGGPLTFVPALRKVFCTILNLRDEDLVLPGNSEYFPAWGAALDIGEDSAVFTIGGILSLLERNTAIGKGEFLTPLFGSEPEYRGWKANRNIKKLGLREIRENETVDCFIGIDSGSTTTKIVAMDGNSDIIFRFYDANEGNSLKKVTEGIKAFYAYGAEKGATVNVLSSAVTGYGEDLVKSALDIDYGIVETMAHLSGAQYVDPQVSFVLDIGGQDIKSLFVHNRVISNIELNEACSAGCGSFLQNFASTMNIPLDDFSSKACLSSRPADLGSRCTVFMNSKVKQSLRENAVVDDIAAGLAYSVVKNCLFKVLKISNLDKLGDNIVVQGGTFRNDAVYRALELLSGKSVSSTDHPELMGAFGAALYSRRQWETERKGSSFRGLEAVSAVETMRTTNMQCHGCTNQCSILKFVFDNGNTSYAGNKCEKIFHNSGRTEEKGYNAFDRKNEMLFNLPKDTPTRGKVGIPRVLNMYENYPFWHTLFTECGYEAVLSPESNFELYRTGVGSVMSDNICFPAKLVHGHFHSLIDSKVDRIFYPLVPKEEKEFGTSTNSWNCPVVSGYPDVIRSSIDPEGKYGLPFDRPIIGFNDDKVLRNGCREYFEGLGVPVNVFKRAFKKALENRAAVVGEMRGFQQRLLEEAIAKAAPVFIIAGRPYHADPLIHQKTGQILCDLGVTVLTDDVFREDDITGFENLNVVSQWAYPNRVVQSALKIAKMPRNVQLIQLNSFGCGPDSFYMDEASSILKAAGKNLTVIRIDEIASPGAVRLRLRSLVESLGHNAGAEGKKKGEYRGYNVPYTENDRKKTILLPWLSDFISPFMPAIGELAGYNIVNLPQPDRHAAETGLKYGHSEVCYPSTLVLGAIIDALKSGNYDLKDIVVGITQTGGQCRATNYIAQIKTGLERAGFTDIPLVALTTGKTFQNNQKAFRIPWAKVVNITVYTVLYGDGMQQMFAAVSAREKNKGETKALFDHYMDLGSDSIRKNDHKLMLSYLRQAVADFNNIPVYEREYAKIGVVGEIYVKYNNYAQANISQWLREQGMEVVTPPILDFVMQYFVNSSVNMKIGLKRGSKFQQSLNPLMWKYMNKRINDAEAIMKGFRYYQPSSSVFTKAAYASEILSLSNQFGEGWAIAAEVAHYAHQGVNKVVCAQPFGCIANHVVAKGIEKRLKRFYPDMNLLYLDIDSGVAEVNLHNRLHFMIG